MLPSVNVKVLQEEFKDTKGVIRIRISKDRQYNDQTKKRQKYKYYTENQSDIFIIRSNHNGRTDNTMGKRNKDKSTNTTQKTKVTYL